MAEIVQKAAFAFRFKIFKKLVGAARKMWLSLLGMQVGRNTHLPRLHVTWPNQVSIGRNCILEHNILFKFDGIWKEGKGIIIENNVFIGSNCEFNIKSGITIGSDSLIASGCKFIDHDHGMYMNKLMRLQPCLKEKIAIGKNVWLGFNVIILKGVTIEDGVVVAAGAVVTKSIPANEIWGGIPARRISDRNQYASVF